MSEIKIGKDRASLTLVTPKGELTGFNAVFTPSTKFNKEGMYNANILLTKEDGEKLEALIKEVQTTQFKEFKKGKQKKAEVKSIRPYTTADEEGNEIADAQGRYILKVKAKARIKNDKAGVKIAVFDAKGRPVKDCRLGEGSIVRLKLNISGYSVADKVGVSVTLTAVQIIKLVEYATGGSFDGFDIEEDGFDSEGADEVVKEMETDGDEEASF